eukprot:13350318-Alexandrium_andersonii.AAC.1
MKSKVRSSEVVRALGYPLGKKGEVLGENSTGHSNRASCTCSFGPPETAVRYCASSWYCRNCHAGDSKFEPRACSENCDQARPKDVLQAPKQFGKLDLIGASKKHEWAIEQVKKGASYKDI